MQVMDDWMTLLVFFSIEPMVTWGTAILGNAQLSSRRGSGQGHPFEIVRRRRCGIAALGRPCTTADGRIFFAWYLFFLCWQAAAGSPYLVDNPTSPEFG